MKAALLHAWPWDRYPAMKNTVERALEYPYDILQGSCIVRNGAIEELGDAPCSDIIEDFIAGYLPRERMRSFPPPMQQFSPVIAYGSNRSGRQLARKFSGAAPDTAVLLLRAALFDFDVVYSAHLSEYGAVPATLQSSPGLETEVSVMFLEPELLCRLHRSERAGEAYDFVHLWDVRLHIGEWPPYFEAYTYISRPGPLVVDGKPIGLKAIPARGHRGPAMDQIHVQGWLYERMHGAPPRDGDIERFITALEGEEGIHLLRERNRVLGEYAGEFQHDSCEVIPVQVERPPENGSRG